MPTTSPNQTYPNSYAGKAFDLTPEQQKANEAYLAKPVTALSSNNGVTALNNAVANHTQDMTNIANNTATPSAPAPKLNEATINLLKNNGAVDETTATSLGLNKNDYNFDSSSGLYIPKSGTTSEITKTNKQYDEDVSNINSTFSSISASLDASTQALISSIQGIYSARIQEQQDANKRELAAFNTINTRYGTARYAPGVAQGILTADERVGLDRIKKIALEEANLIATAQNNLQDKKYNLFIQQRQALDSLRKERLNILTDLQDKAYKVQEETRKKSEQVKIDSAVAEQLGKGTTDLNTILKTLNDSGIKATSEDVKKAVQNLNPDGDLSKLSADSRDFFILKANGGKGLPASILALPEDQQMLAYIRMKTAAETKPPASKTPAVNQLTPNEAQKYGFPPEMIGMNEKEILISLQSPEPPQWFLDVLQSKAGGNPVAVADSNIMFSLWEQFRLEALSKISPEEETKTRNYHTQAKDYFIATYGFDPDGVNGLTTQDLNTMASIVQNYVNQGLTYEDAILQAELDAQQ